MKSDVEILKYEIRNLGTEKTELFLDGALNISFFLINESSKTIWLDNKTASLFKRKPHFGLSYTKVISCLDKKDQSYLEFIFASLKNKQPQFNFHFTMNSKNYQMRISVLKTKSRSILYRGILVEYKQSFVSEGKAKQDTSFISSMTHEIRSPLNAIIGHSQLLQETKLDIEQKESLDNILTASTHLKTLVDNILDYSKIEAGKMAINQDAFDIQKLISDVQSMFLEQITQKNIYFDVLNVNCPKTMIGDENRLRQVLLNFVSNAIKFTEIGGISLTSYIDYEISDSSLRINFKVKDTGIGMSEAEVAKLFTPFEQANAQTSRIYGGTGLGLAISDKLAILMGGEIIVTSQVNNGTEIVLSVPLTYDKAVRNLEVEENRKPKSGSKILLVEDNKMNQKLTSRILANYGMLVTIAENGQEAVNLYNSHSFDLIFMDLQMPILDGVSATRMIRKTNKTIPILALTSDSMFENIDMCLSVGMNDYIIKPVDPKKLYRALLKWLPSE